MGAAEYWCFANGFSRERDQISGPWHLPGVTAKNFPILTLGALLILVACETGSSPVDDAGDSDGGTTTGDGDTTGDG
uniref:hypothetical protein n=1 Tax=Enhygromyxa salina TaxID=215803 RepID=UPI001C6356A8